MKRQLVIGGLVGIALGGLLTFSIANDVFAFASGSGDAESAPADEQPRHEGRGPKVGAVWSAYDGLPPLRPGSDRVAPAADRDPEPPAPVALDRSAAPDAPTV